MVVAGVDVSAVVVVVVVDAGLNAGADAEKTGVRGRGLA